jgi:hypothetical protein
MPNKDEQMALFDMPEQWEEFWQDMPEFSHEKIEAEYTIICRFRNKDDLLDFGKKINQNVTEQTKSIWHPKLIFNDHHSKRYFDNDEVKKGEKNE